MMTLTHDLASDKAYSPQTATVALRNGLGLTIEGADATLGPVQRTLRRIDSGHSAAFVAELRQQKKQRDELVARSSSLGKGDAPARRVVSVPAGDRLAVLDLEQQRPSTSCGFSQ